jgi:hypothetical protein
MREIRTNHEDGSKAGPILSTTEARQGVTTGRIRYVLAVSTALAIIGMVVAYIAI